TGTRRSRTSSDFDGKPLGGKAARGREWNPAEPAFAAAAARAEVNEPRPYTSRYPIPNARFESLKAAAPKAKLPKVTCERVKDSRKSKDEIIARPMPAAPLAPGLAPAAAPTASMNFAGIGATGWLPPDCTMATGPQHVLLSVNSSVAIYTKAGAVALPQRTLTQWFANVAPQGVTIFDPKALYDQHAGRWVLLAVAVQNSPKKSPYLLSVSNSSNPVGPWRNYALDATKDGNLSPTNSAAFPRPGVGNLPVFLPAH